MTRTYKVKSGRDGGTASFLCPPGHARLGYSLYEYTSPRGRTPIGIMSIDYALTDEADASEEVKAQVRAILASAETTPSEAWVRNVYGYFRSMYAPESGSRNVSEAVSDRDNTLPPERHLGYLTVKEYFPTHEPRTDLIADPGKGYGAYPCVKCGQTVQYEARYDAHVTVSTRVAAGCGTVWEYGKDCPQGGAHSVE